MLGLGIMSGTSADAIDVALVRFSAGKARLENFASIPYPARAREVVLGLGEGRATSTGEISQLNFLLGEIFADAALAACRKFKVRAAQVKFIGSHGQTVFHQGAASQFCGKQIASTLQIGDASVIAVRTGITTVGDFRPADMAAGGQGAPLVPFVDYLLYRSEEIGRAALNIGGIANVTVIPKAGKLSQVFAFDTGPGNMAIDALVRHYSAGRKTFDRNAEIAAKGNVIPGLLATLIRDKYFQKSPPKTAGREQYGAKYLETILSHSDVKRAKAEDVIHTATILTALAVVDAFHRLVLPKTKVTELIISGGGARNPLLTGQIKAALPNLKVRTSGELGIPSHAKEAYAFAILGHETLNKRSGNVPSATGAKRPVILGKVCHAG